jgi:radical SAM protein with 4Fe4S-binding SPASM domain
MDEIFNRLVNQVLKKKAVGPYFVEIRPTNACQLNCVGCWNYSPYLKIPKTLEWKKQHLSLETYQKLINDLLDLNVKQIVFSGGGDPLAHPEICEFIKIAKKAGFNVGIISNLLLVKDVKSLADSGLDWVIANFSAGSPEVYKAYHPNQPIESFDKLLQIIDQLVEKQVHIDLNCVLCRFNYRDIDNMIYIAAKTTKLISFKILTGSETIGTDRVILRPDQIQELKQNLPKHQKLAEELNVTHNFNMFNQALKGDFNGQMHFPIHKISCYAGYYTSLVEADGNISVCCHANGVSAFTQEHYSTLGNINEMSFKDIWNSSQYEETREKLTKRQYFGFCKNCTAHFFFNNADLTQRLTELTQSSSN